MEQGLTYVKPFYWTYSDKLSDKAENYFSYVVFAHEYNSGKTVALHIKYEPWIDIVLPTEVTSNDVEIIKEYVFQGLKRALGRANHAPTRYKLSMRLPLYYYTTKERFCLQMHFKTEDAVRHCKNLLKKPLKIYEHSMEIPLLIAGESNGQLERFHAELNIRPCDWIAFNGSLVADSSKVTTCKMEYEVDYRHIKALGPEIQDNLGLAYPSCLVFDHEMFAHRKYSFPDELNSEDCIFTTGMLFFQYNMQEKRYDSTEYCLVYHKTIKPEDIGKIPCTKLKQISDSKYEIEDDDERIVIVEFFDEEIPLTNAIERYIRMLDPDGIIGHNSNSFDFKYHKVRKGRLAENYTNMSRNKDWNQGFKNIKWESSAYHEINLWVPDGDGRIYFDTMLMAKRDYKEDSYGLDALCQKYMGIGKHDWTPEDIFNSFRNDDPEALRKTIRYCMQDVWCTWGLFQHLNFWASYSGMSNIMGVGIFELFSRGQGIRNRTLMFKQCHAEGYYLYTPPRTNRRIAGGYVFPQVPGLYEYIILVDFEGLYPSIMRRFNISNDTFDINEIAKDEDCFIFNWADDHGDWSTRFVKPHIRKGIVPKLLEGYYNSRNAAKAKMREAKSKGDTRGAMVYNVEQLANKVSANSVYGGISQSGGKLALSEAGAAVTAYGRMLIQKAAKWAEGEGYEVKYGDTDSIFIARKIPFTREEIPKLQEIAEELVGRMNKDCFTKPINMEVDGIFRTFLSISKKMYSMIAYDKKDPFGINPDLWKSKGLVTAKRDSCKMIRNLYKQVAVMITCKKSFMEVLETVANELQRLLYGELDIKEMISMRKLGKGYANKNAELPTFQRHLHEHGMNVKPGDRLPFVYAKRDPEPQYMGEKWEDPDIFIREGLEYDRIQYLKSQFQNKLDTILHVSFPEYVPAKFIAKIPDILDRRPGTPVIEMLVAIIDIHTQ